MRARRTLVAVLAVLAAAATVTGCASMPSASSIHEESDVQAKGQQAGHVRVFGQPPQDGEDQLGVVSGFLEALTSDEAGYDTARKYLTPAARRTWRPDDRTIIYAWQSDLPLRLYQNQLVLEANEVAWVDAQGSYHPSPRGQRFNATFQLTKVDGQWRVASLPDGVYISVLDFQRLYTPLNRYYFDPDHRGLVPDPIYVPFRPGQITAVVRSLLAGPSAWLRAGVVTDIPNGTRLVGNSVRIDGGVPQVELSDEVLRADTAARENLSAQIVWTLAQLGVKEVRVSAKGGTFAAEGTPEVRSPQRYPQYDPAKTPDRTDKVVGYFQQKGKLMRVLGKPLAAVPGPFGDARLQLSSFAVSLGSDRAAGVSEDENTLYVGGLGAGSKATAVLTGQGLTEPSWDGLGRVWVGDRTSGGPRLRFVSGGNKAEEVAFTDVRPRAIGKLRISADGTRLALLIPGSAGTSGTAQPSGSSGSSGASEGAGGTGASGVAASATSAGSTLWVGTIGRTSPGSGTRLAVYGLHRIVDQLTDVRDVWWMGADQLALLGEDSQEVLSPYQVNVDGSGLVAGENGPGQQLVSIAAAQGQDLLAGTSDGWIWRSSSGHWTKIASGVEPLYPG